MKKRLRAEIFDAYVQMGQRGLLVDPELYQRVRANLANEVLCGRYARSSDLERELPPQPSPSRRQRAQPGSASYDIEAIVAEEPATKKNWERYLVRWAGYSPAWEAWRIPGRGVPGDAVETWEPLSAVKHTEAFERWKAAQAQQS